MNNAHLLQSTTPAPASHLAPGLVADLQTLQAFFDYQLHLMRRLYGRPYLRPSGARDVLIRYVLLEFARGNRVRVSDCQRRCSEFGSMPTIRREIHMLESCGLIHLSSDTEDQRGLLITPSQRLIEFCNDHLAALRDRLSVFIEASTSPNLLGTDD